jgi:hypothetical protein
MTNIVFNPQTFLARYPEFSTIDQVGVIASASVPAASTLLTVNTMTSGVVVPTEAVSGLPPYVPNAIPFGVTIASNGTGTGQTGTYNLSAPALVALTNAPLTLYAWNLLPQYAAEAGLYTATDDSGLITDIPTLTTMLNMLTAHIAALNSGVWGQQAGQQVGRIKSVGEGSVHVDLDFSVPGTEAWFAQTKYGAAYWQAATPYRLGGLYGLDDSLVQPDVSPASWGLL